MNLQGSVAFEAGGKAYALRLSINALCLLDERINKSIMDVALELEANPRLPTLRAVFWAGLGDPNLTMGEAGDIVGAVGLKEAIRIAREALAAAFPDPEPAQDGADTRPRVAAAG